MEGEGTEQDYDEFEILLGEIPNATSTNPRTEDSVLANSSPHVEGLSIEGEGNKSSPPTTFTKFDHASKVTNPGRNTVFFGGLSFERPTIDCVNSFQVSFNQKPQMKGKLEGGKITVNNSHQSRIIKRVDREDSDISENQSLTSTFTQLNLKDGIAIEVPNLAQINRKTLLNHKMLLEGQFLNHLNKPLSSLDSRSMVVPSCSTSNTLNVRTFVNSTTDILDKVNMEMNSEEGGKLFKLNNEELRKQKSGSCQKLVKLSGAMEEQQQSVLVNSGATPLAPTHTYQVLSSVPVTGVFSVMPYQQECFLDEQSPIRSMQPHQLSRSHIAWQHTDEDQYSRMCQQQLIQSPIARQHIEEELWLHQQYLSLQHHWNQRSESHKPIQGNVNATIGAVTRNVRQPYFEMPLSYHFVQANKDPFGLNAAIQREFNPYELTLMGSGICSYCTQGFYGSGEGCPFAHCHKQTSLSGFGYSSPNLHAEDFEADHFLEKVGQQIFPEKILTKSHELSSLTAIQTGSIGEYESPNYANSNGRLLTNGNFHHRQSILSAGSFQLNGQPSFSSSPDHMDLRHKKLRSLPHIYNSVDEVMGKIYFMAKDQCGCRFLQRKFMEGTAEDVNKIFVEIIGHIVELMTDPFGNYLVQKLLEVCNEDQMMHILNAITRKTGVLVSISCDSHGTRSVQKVIETLKTREQFSIVVSSLKPGIVKLAKDINGNHVVQRCLEFLQPEYNEFLFEAAIAHFIELAKDRHGCCVLQKCLRHSDGKRRRLLICKIISNALMLSQDQFGNYVVQYAFELQVPWATVNVLNQLVGNYVYLSMQKFSSNVVEKCLKYAGEELRPRIIHELMINSRFDQILQDPYGNYVIQAALDHSKGALHASLVEAIKPYVTTLHTSPYGKKVLSRINLK